MKVTDKSLDLERFIQAILSEQIKVGEVVRQRDLCEILGMSMTPLRELLVLLEELELVEAKPSAGYRITYPDLNFMRENMQFRVMIEEHAIEPFIVEVQDDWIEEQARLHEEAIQGLESLDNIEAHNELIIELDRGFHRTIVAALKNKAISKAHEYTQIKLSIARRVHRRIPPRQTNKNAMQEHLEILSALRRKNASDVKATLDSHFAGSIRNTLIGY